LPDQARAVVESVHDCVPSSVGGPREGEDASAGEPVVPARALSFRGRAAQWKYWPPSITIVWPVMKSAAGLHRKTTAPTTSSGTWSRWIVRAAIETSRSF